MSRALRFVFLSGVSADCSGLVVSHALRFVFLSGVSADWFLMLTVFVFDFCRG